MKQSLIALAMVVLAACFGATSAQADELQLRADHPERYIVQKGDTLWDISGKFLENPWNWPKIWDYNSQIKNPHLIFPGDELVLVWLNGKPQLQVSRGKAAGTIKLSPFIRKTPVDAAITTIPLEAVKPFVQMHRFIDERDLKHAPYIVGGDNLRVLSGRGSKIYARGEFGKLGERYTVFREGKVYRHSQTNKKLGLHIQQLGEAELIAKEGELATLMVERSTTGLRSGDYLLPATEDGLQAVFTPKPVAADIHASILDVDRGVRNAGVFDVVMIDAGQNQGVEIGNVFAAMKVGERIRDHVKNQWLDLPPEQAGTVMVFKTFADMSYGLIMSASSPLSVGDLLSRP